MLRNVAFTSLCLMLAFYGVFKLDTAYSTFAAETAPPPANEIVVKRTVDPIGDADAYAMSQINPAAGTPVPPVSPVVAVPTRPLPVTTVQDRGAAENRSELLELLSDSGIKQEVSTLDTVVNEATNALRSQSSYP